MGAINNEFLLVRMGLGDEIFEHEDYDTGVHRFFNTTRLYRYAEEHGERILIANPGFEDLARHAEQHHGVEERKINRLCEPHLSRPILGVLWPDGSTCLVDGNHRVVRLWRDGVTEVEMYRVKLSECEPYLVKGLPDGLIAGKKP